MSNNHQQRKAASQDPFSHWTPYWPPPPAYKIWPQRWYLFWYVFACVCMCFLLFVFVHVFWSVAMTILANCDHHKMIRWGPPCPLSMAMAILDIMTILAIYDRPCHYDYPCHYKHHQMTSWGPQCPLSLAMTTIDIMTILVIMTNTRWPGGRPQPGGRRWGKGSSGLDRLSPGFDSW